MTFKVNIDTGSSTNGFTDVVPSSDSTALPSASTISRSFNTTGVSESSITLNYKKAAVGTTNTLTVRIQGKAVAMTGLTVEPNVASSIAVTKVNSTAISGSAIPAATAGSAFSLEAEIRDQFGNPTWKSTSNANCSGTALTVSSTSGTSPGNTGAIGTATTFDPAAVTNKSTMTSSTSGNYALGNIILYAAGSKSLVLSACGLSPSFSVTVNPASAANMAINATGIGNTTRISEYECDNTGTNEVVKCAALYASFWDQYGNPRISDTCDSWAYVTNNGAPVPPYSTAAVASQTLAQLTHATDKHFDGTLTCNKSGITSNNAVLLWGGVKQVTLTTSPATIPASMTAANANLKVTNIKIETPKGGVMTTPTKSLVKPIIFKSNSGTARLSTQTSTILNGANGLSQSCTFASATASVECTPSPSYDFNFIKAETGVYLDVSVHGVAATRLGTFNVTPGNASKIVLTEVAGSAATTLGTRTAGTAFTFVSQIQDSFDNPTTLSTTGSDCSTSALTLSGGGGSSPGGTSTSIGTATAFSAAAATGTSSMNNTTSATYSVGNVILYTAGSQSLSLQACGVPATPFTVTVSPAAVANVALNKESSASNIQLTEFECENSGTGMTCPAMNAWFWDAYGNARSTDTCDSWSYATTGSAPVPPFNAATTTKAATQSVVNLTNSSASYYNGVLTCNNSRSGVGTGGTFSTSPSVRLWGGVSQVTLSHNVSGSSIAASLGNVQITNVSLRTPKDATLTAPTKNPTGATTRRIFFTTNATSAAMQNGGGTTALTAATSTSAYADCAFVAGASFADCSVSASPYRFNFTKAETGRTFDVTVQGVNATPQIGFEVTGGTANQLTVSTAPPSTVTAGADFGLNLAVKDTWNNPTSSGCGAVTITGPTASPSTGPSGTTSTSFDLSQAAGQTAPSSLGVYNISALKLYNATTQSLNISACGLNASTSPSVTVKPASPKAGTLTATNSRSTTSATELVCTNSSTSPFAVGCGSATAYAWFWDLYGNQITSSNNSTANDVNCDSWNFSQQTGVTGFTATGGTNSLSSSITQGSATAKWVDGTLSCVKTGVTSPSIVVWGGLQSVAIAAQDSSSNVITSTNPTLTAATGNLKVSQIVLKAQKGGSEVTNSNFGSTLSVTWNTDATPLASAASGGWTTSGSGTSTPFGRAQIESLTFAGGIYSSPIPFNFVKAETGRKVSASVLGVASNMVQFGVSEANVNSITLNASPTTANVGDDVTMTVSAIDAFGNPSFGNCTTATLSAASSLNAPNGTAPTLPGAALTQSGTKGTFNAGIVKFFKAGSGQTIQADACAKTANSQAVTVNAGASLQQILLTTTNAQPAYNTTLSESSDLACTTGSTVQCPTIYAYGEDAHGNPKGAVTCSSWSFAVEGSSSAPVVSNTSGTSTTVTNASTHVDGVLTCQASTLQRTVPLLGKITKTPDLSCSAWACNAGAAESTCTLSNNTGYGISAVSVSPSPGVNNCTTTLGNGSNCTFTYTGTTGASAGNTSVTSTPSDNSVVVINDAIAAISGGTTPAPSCP
jgi:hypothetical protein